MILLISLACVSLALRASPSKPSFHSWFPWWNWLLLPPAKPCPLLSLLLQSPGPSWPLALHSSRCVLHPRGDTLCSKPSTSPLTNRGSPNSATSPCEVPVCSLHTPLPAASLETLSSLRSNDPSYRPLPCMAFGSCWTLSRDTMLPCLPVTGSWASWAHLYCDLFSFAEPFSLTLPLTYRSIPLVGGRESSMLESAAFSFRRWGPTPCLQVTSC